MIQQIRNPDGLDQWHGCRMLCAMLASQSNYSAPEIAAALGWLVEAGVDTVVDATPRNWLAAPVRAAAMPAATTVAAPAKRPPAASPVITPSAMQLTSDVAAITTVAALEQAVLGFAHPLRRADVAPQLLVGAAESRIIILCDQPESNDTQAAVLRSRMLAAIGLDQTNCAILHRMPWPMTGGRAPRGDELTAFAPFVSRALELVQPQAILALGQLAAAIAGDSMALASARGRWQEFAVGDSLTPLLASLHPRLLLSQPARKREAWADLQAFAARLAHS